MKAIASETNPHHLFLFFFKTCSQFSNSSFLGVRIGTFGSTADCGLTSTVCLPGDDFSSVWERSEEMGKKKKTFSKSEEETARCKKKQDGYRIKGDREKDLFGFC